MRLAAEPDANAETAWSRRVIGWAWMDTILRHRARDILRRSGLSTHLPPAGLMLDIGGGSGHLSEAVLRRMPGRRCIVADPVHATPEKLAARMEHRAYSALRATGECLPFADGCFDAAWIGFVLHHIEPARQERVLQEAARIIRPAGVFVLLEDTPSTPAEYRATLSADRRLNMEPRSAPHHYRSPGEWRAILPKHGFRIVAETAFTRLFPPATFRKVWHRAFVCHRV